MTDVIIKTENKPQYRFDVIAVGTVFSWGGCVCWYVKTASDTAVRIGHSIAAHTLNQHFFRGRNLTCAATVEITPEA